MKGGIALLAVVPSLAFACINDRDTLKFEQQNVNALERITAETNPEKRSKAVSDLALRAIAGRFERFPDKYYEMRISRLEAKGSLSAAEFDDLAVAYDRIGKVDKAIQLILKSKSLRKNPDDQYRFHANYGTFLVHKWFAQGAKSDQKPILKESIAEIQQALEINPKSHFGRESIQLALEKAWLNPDKEYDLFAKLDPQDVAVGASGIIMMGLGYELPDVYSVLANAGWEPNSLPENAAKFRAQELIKADKPALFSVNNGWEEVRGEYLNLQADGKNVHESRLEYINQRLDRGEHPDTHPAFWEGWGEPEFPTTTRVDIDYVRAPSIEVATIGLAGVLGMGAFGTYVWMRRRG
ncbi:MAG TPA: hypothetical protein VK171_00660 [Fimbriimonas sp.]|nr:hypothetical protein [Fimbriimonas sp.]